MNNSANRHIYQVLRWSALGFGVFYGAYHQLSLSARDKANASKKEWEHKESLIRQAKAEWAKSHPEAQPKSSGGTSKQHVGPLSEFIRVRMCERVCANERTAKADPKDPNADYLAVLGITDN
jgi:F-type H+-transporting ATP synthase subunit e